MSGNTSNIGFEKQIWDAACVLRGNIDASEYKSVVLGLIFLKYISDRFEAKYKELVEEGDGFEEDKDEYTAENIFFVPENARWGVIAAAAHTPEIGTVIDDAMRSIEKENRRLKDILPKNFAGLSSDGHTVALLWMQRKQQQLFFAEPQKDTGADREGSLLLGAVSGAAGGRQATGCGGAGKSPFLSAAISRNREGKD